MTDTNAIKLHRLRRFVDSELERLTGQIDASIFLPQETVQVLYGMIYFLEKIRVLYLLNDQEQAEVERTRRVMFDNDPL